MNNIDKYEEMLALLEVVKFDLQNDDTFTSAERKGIGHDIECITYVVKNKIDKLTKKSKNSCKFKRLFRIFKK